jgi:A/G-specific adenine glycosylase
MLDGNAKRVLARCFGTEENLWELAERLLPQRDIAVYTQALMDLGATVCTRNPSCAACPVKARCVARRTDRVHEVPAPRERKALPLKKTVWFVYRHAGKVLLERRPSNGIWGGLWCFPEIDGTRLDMKLGLEQECLARFGLRIGASQRLSDIEHGFTHFRLRITPVLVRTDRTPGACEPGSLWLTPEDARGAAIPAPVRKIIDALEDLGARG